MPTVHIQDTISAGHLYNSCRFVQIKIFMIFIIVTIQETMHLILDFGTVFLEQTNSLGNLNSIS